MATEPHERGAAGWYPDPDQAATVRYWDGAGWTDQRAPATGPAVPQTPVVVPASADITMRAVIGVAGSIAAAVAVFLPMVDSNTSLHIADNSIFAQSQVGGIIALAVALAGAGAAVESRHRSGIAWSLLILGAIVIAGAVYAGTGERVELVTTGPLIGGHNFQGSPGIGVYVLGVGGALMMLAGFIGGGATTTPDAGAATVDRTRPPLGTPASGFHPLDPDGYSDEEREAGWYVDPHSPWTMRRWDEGSWTEGTRKTPKVTLDGWWKVKR